jgi:Raf kinase inhibitor-like YbhB/YbcL family protein
MVTKLTLKLYSTAFKEGERIPAKHTCDGENISPVLRWDKANDQIKSRALIMDDPDASRGIFTHWLIYNIPSDITSLPEGIPIGEKAPNGALQGKNSGMSTGYSGPCPPPGPFHHYNFNLYGLDTMLDLPAGASRKQVQEGMKGHIVSQGKLVGIYQRTE